MTVQHILGNIGLVKPVLSAFKQQISTYSLYLAVKYELYIKKFTKWLMK